MKHIFCTAMLIALLPATACSFDDRPSSHLPYRADFHACPFPVFSDDRVDMKCAGDSYHMQMHARSHSSQSASYVISPEVGAIRIDATARLVSAVPDAAAGVACISTDGKRGYAFVRWSDAVGILESRGGGWRVLTETAAAPPPADGRSAIGATCVTDARGATYLQMDVDGTVA